MPAPRIVNRFLWLTLLIVLFDQLAPAQNKGFGLGIIVGDPTGLSGKQWLSRQTAIDVGLAWSFRNNGYVNLHADYLWHFESAITSSERFVPYVGVGGRLGTGSSTRLGVRIVGGLAFWPHEAPFDVFIEIAPIMDLVPSTTLTANGGIGARFFFR